MEKLHGFTEQTERNLQLLGQAGMAVSVVQNDEVIFAGGFGCRDAERRIRPDERTVFPIGSATKSFTAAAVALLCARGLLDLDRPIREYMPELEFRDPTAALLATPRDLLCHRTGLPRHDMLWVLRPYIARRELPGLIRELDASQPFRTKYQYNNLMYACLGRLVEKVDGRAWEDFVAEEFFAPLEMKSACFTPDAAIVNGNFSLAYERSRKTGELDGVPYSRLGGMAPAGAINANVLELANWVRFHLAKGTFQGKQILKEEYAAQLYEPCMPTHDAFFEAPEIRPLGYALGWEVESFRGRKLVMHGGNVAGSSALVAFMPEINAGVSVLVNTGTSMLPSATVYDVFDRLLGYGGEKDWAELLKQALDKLYQMIDGAYGAREGEARPAKTVRADGEFAGVYRHPTYGAIKILVDEEGALCARWTGQTLKLKNVHYDIFSAKLTLDYQTVPLLVGFQTGIDGRVASLEMTLEAAVKPIVFKKDTQPNA